MTDHYSAAQRNQWLRETPPNCHPSNMAGRSDCAVCGGHGFEFVQLGNEISAAPCRCIMSTSYYRSTVMGLPDKFAKCGLDNYDTSEPEKAKAHRTASVYCEQWPNVSKGLLFAGPNGTGKTHLAVAVAKQLSGTEKDVRFVDVQDLFSKLRGETMSEKGETIGRYKDANILVLDDLGIERSTDYTLDVLNELLQHRYNTDRITIITTNVANSTELSKKLGPRISDRLN